MRRITLTKGYHALVDDTDYERIAKHRWQIRLPGKYAARAINTPRAAVLYMHHQVLGVWPWELRPRGLVVDHIDRDSLNNCRSNLRIVTYKENSVNRATKSWRAHITYNLQRKEWKAYLDEPNKPRRSMGPFRTYEDAEIAVRLNRQGWPL